MFSVKKVQEEVNAGNSLKEITEAFTDIASIKLRRIRSDIERNRKFVDEITNLYWLVKQESIKRRVIFLAQKKGTLSILVTSNLPFYGSINYNLTQSFIIGSNKYDTDRLIIGLQGKKLLLDMKYGYPFKSLVFKLDLPDADELSKLVKEISVYKQVLIFYPQMQSILVQIPTVLDVTQVSNQKQYLTSSSNLDYTYIFEPEVSKMIRFFEDQILITLLEQAFLESELSRTASRLISMDLAQINADKYIKFKKIELSLAIRNYANSRILDSTNTIISLKNAK